MQISVIVPFHNSRKYIEHCIAGLLSQDFQKTQYEIIFVDNNSTDGSAEIVGQYDEIRLIKELKPGSYAARNAGLSQASGELIAFTDSDCIPSPKWLSVIASKFTDPGTSIILGSHSPGGSNHLLSLLVGYGNERSNYVFSSRIRKLYYGYTNNMAIRKSLFAELGPFLERMRGADTIFIQKFLENHSTSPIIYYPEMAVKHLEITKVSDMYRKFFIYGRSRQRYRNIACVRPLTNRERVDVFFKTARNNDYSTLTVASSFIVIVFGLVMWVAGTIFGKLKISEN